MKRFLNKCKEWTAVNEALTKYPEVELPASIHDHTYEYVVNLKRLPSEPRAVMQALLENAKPIKTELKSVDYYTKFIPMIRAVSPSYNLYSQKIEWLELNTQDEN